MTKYPTSLTDDQYKSIKTAKKGKGNFIFAAFLRRFCTS